MMLGRGTAYAGRSHYLQPVLAQWQRTVTWPWALMSVPRTTRQFRLIAEVPQGMVDENPKDLKPKPLVLSLECKGLEFRVYIPKISIQ